MSKDKEKFVVENFKIEENRPGSYRVSATVKNSEASYQLADIVTGISVNTFLKAGNAKPHTKAFFERAKVEIGNLNKETQKPAKKEEKTDGNKAD